MHEVAEIRRGVDCGFAFVPCMPEPERIVSLGFRYWMLGLTTGDIAAWERAWDLYCGLFGTAGAREAIGRLSKLVAALGDAACRDIAVFPEKCRSFSRDECVAVSLIAACQHRAHGATQACARTLMGSEAVDDVIDAAQAFAEVLISLDHILAPPSRVLAHECGGGTALQQFH